MDNRFLRSLRYLCAKQMIDLSVLIETNGQTIEETKRRFVSNSKTIRKSRSLDLSVIHETSFEFASILEKSIDHFPSDSLGKIIVERQPLREIDVNSFNNVERQAEYEKTHFRRALISDDDKENLPVITNKRSIFSTKNEPPNKKHKKTKFSEVGQNLVTNSFQSTN